MLFPATTGFGEAVLVTVSSAAALVPTTVDAMAVLLFELGSLTDELTVATSVITVPLGVPELAFRTNVKVATVFAAILSVVQTSLPPVEVLHVQPAGAEMERNAV